MYTILAYAIPEESHDIMRTALDERAKTVFCSGKNNLLGEISGNEYDLVYLFTGNSKADVALLEKVYQRIPHTPIILVSGDENPEAVVTA